MAYTDPHLWAFKDVTDANTNDYLTDLVDNLTDLAGRASNVNAACASGKVYFFRFGRWIYYKNQSGKTASVGPLNSTLGTPVSLPDVYAKGGATVDLETTVDWLVTGMAYYVDNVEFAIEMEKI